VNNDRDDPGCRGAGRGRPPPGCRCTSTPSARWGTFRVVRGGAVRPGDGARRAEPVGAQVRGSRRHGRSRRRAMRRRPPCCTGRTAAGLRSGTPDVAGAALAAALDEALGELDAETTRLALCRAARDGHPRDGAGGRFSAIPSGAFRATCMRSSRGGGESLLFLWTRRGSPSRPGRRARRASPNPRTSCSRSAGMSGRALGPALTLGRGSTDADVEAVLAVLPEAYARASGARSARRS
jgi:cysteine desulfurase